VSVGSLVVGYLSKNESRIMQLATVGENGPWVCSVYFVYVDERLYWLSFPERRHSKNIFLNPKVATTVMVKADRPTVGVQVAGEAKVVEGAAIVQKVMELYIEKYGEGQQFYDNFLAKTNKHQMYVLTPTEIVLFDEGNFPENGRQAVL
jgi:uncharacterized protein YhbP (UPF0306 family)